MESSKKIIYYSILDCKSFKLSVAKEIVINKRSHLSDLAVLIHSDGIGIEVDQMEATKIRDIWAFNIHDLLEHRFSSLN